MGLALPAAVGRNKVLGTLRHVQRIDAFADQLQHAPAVEIIPQRGR